MPPYFLSHSPPLQQQAYAAAAYFSPSWRRHACHGAYVSPALLFFFFFSPARLRFRRRAMRLLLLVFAPQRLHRGQYRRKTLPTPPWRASFFFCISQCFAMLAPREQAVFLQLAWSRYGGCYHGAGALRLLSLPLSAVRAGIFAAGVLAAAFAEPAREFVPPRRYVALLLSAGGRGKAVKVALAGMPVMPAEGRQKRAATPSWRRSVADSYAPAAATEKYEAAGASCSFQMAEGWEQAQRWSVRAPGEKRRYLTRRNAEAPRCKRCRQLLRGGAVEAQCREGVISEASPATHATAACHVTYAATGLYSSLCIAGGAGYRR